MRHGLTWIVLGAVGSLSAGAALARDFSDNLVPRCQVAELTAMRGAQDPCREEMATFGLHGPMVLSQTRDVETTGSVTSGPTRHTTSGERR
jgi:hypothetical protein